MLEVQRLTPEQWSEISEKALNFSFAFDYPREKNRIALALVVKNKSTDELCGYSTIVEFDSESAYMQHGGNFPPIRGTTLTLKAYLLMVDYLRAHYKFISTRICNRNVPMLKLALAAGFLITGTQLDSHGDLYLVLETGGAQT